MRPSTLFVLTALVAVPATASAKGPSLIDAMYCVDSPAVAFAPGVGLELTAFVDVEAFCARQDDFSIEECRTHVGYGDEITIELESNAAPTEVAYGETRWAYARLLPCPGCGVPGSYRGELVVPEVLVGDHLAITARSIWTDEPDPRTQDCRLLREGLPLEGTELDPPELDGEGDVAESDGVDERKGERADEPPAGCAVTSEAAPARGAWLALLVVVPLLRRRRRRHM